MFDIRNTSSVCVRNMSKIHSQTKKTQYTSIFLIKCLLLPLYYSSYTRMCNKSQRSNPFKNGKACLLLQPPTPVSHRTFPTACYRQINNKKEKNLLRFQFLRFTTVTQLSKGAANNINTENLHNSTFHPFTKELRTVTSLLFICFPKVN